MSPLEKRIDQTVYRPTSEPILTPGHARRLDVAIGRAVRGTYGARTGLRTIVRGVVTELMAEGATPETIADQLERCVRDHPIGHAHDRRNLITGALHSSMLVDLARRCVDELAPAGRATLARSSAP